MSQGRPTALPRAFVGKRPFVLAGGLLLLLGAGATGLLLERDRTGEGNGPIAVTDEPVSSPTPLSSVAVLPFVDMSPDGDLEYLADGIAEEILNTLAGIRELRVPARTSSFHFKGRNLPVREIAEQLGVSHVLEGSLRKAGEPLSFGSPPPPVGLPPCGSTPTGRSPGPRAAYPGSAASWANLTLNGQTSWVFCRFTHFRIPLGTGRRTIRETSR